MLFFTQKLSVKVLTFVGIRSVCYYSVHYSLDVQFLMLGKIFQKYLLFS